MGIQAFCARFKLGTKITAVGLGFVGTIVIISGINYFAASVLQKRIDASSDVVNALTGFKNVYAGMTLFLQHASEDSRDKLYDEITRQKNVLSLAEHRLSATDGRAVITSAADATSNIERRVGDLWSLHEKETQLRLELENDLSAMADFQAKTATEQQKLEQSIRDSEQSAKMMLQTAEYLDGTSRFFGKLATDLNQSSIDKLPGIANSRGRFVSKQLEKSVEIIPPATAAAMRKIADGLNRLSASDPSVDYSPVRAEVASLSAELDSSLKEAATGNMRGATRIFSDLNQRSSLAVAVVGYSRQFSYDLAVAQALIARYLGQPTPQHERSLMSSIDILSSDLEKFTKEASGLTFFDGLPAVMGPTLSRIRTNASELRQIFLDRTGSFNETADTIETVWSALGQLVVDQKALADQERQRANLYSLSAVFAGVAIAGFAVWLLIVTLKTPIQRITAVMLQLASGKDPPIETDTKRLDEIGDMARALTVFRDNAQAKLRVEAESALQRQEGEKERARNESERQAANQQIETAVSHLAGGLEQLAKGNLAAQIATMFDGPLEKVRNDFNSAATRLHDTLYEIRDETAQLQNNGDLLGESAHELSRRSEAQAASLEQTAAAMEQIANIVRSTAEQAERVNIAVGSTKKVADDSAKVASDALDAMVRIEDASKQIEQIISVIDEISFQTNLLALNAGVEAARAGESGKGFAVVAQEVRELAQRSGAAAEEVKTLISRSANEVQVGSRMVRDMNAVLKSIGSQIVSVSEEIQSIAASSRTQAASVSEVNAAIGHMDQITQQNAAMVGETTALGRSVSDLALSLRGLVDRFTLRSSVQSRETASARRSAEIIHFDSKSSL